MFGTRRLAVCATFSGGAFAALWTLRPALALARGDDLAVSVAWLLAVACAAWLFITTTVCVGALATGRTRIAQTTARVMPAITRRLVEAAVMSAYLASVAAPAHALAPPPAVITLDEPVVRAPTAAPAPAPAPTPAPAPRARMHLVKTGDNLWLIARAETGARDDPTIARYWTRLIAANRETLRSGDPSLIYPGELVALPEPE